jgi:hypothetical protein
MALAACSHTAEHSVTRGSASSSIVVVDAPVGAVLQVEDRTATADDEGELRLAVSDGWHEVHVFSGGRTIHSERIFVQDGTRRVIDLQP